MISKQLPDPEIFAFSGGVDTPFPPGYKKTTIGTPGYALEYCFHGRGRLTINSTSYEISAGQCFVTYPYSLLTFEVEQDASWAKSWVMFRGSGMPAVLDSMGISPETPLFPWRNHSEIHECIKEIWPIVKDSSKSLRVIRFQQSACAHRLLALIAAACDQYQNERFPRNRQEGYIHCALQFIDDCITSVTVDKVADYVGLNRVYFSTLFHQYIGETPQNYIIKRRMQYACTLFQNPLSTAYNVAYTLGYEPSSFCRQFKKVIGMTPMEYKAKTKNTEAAEK